MRRIIKTRIPSFWSDYLSENPTCRYKGVADNSSSGEKSAEEISRDRDLIKKMRAYLMAEQKYICAYCCKRLKEDETHNEHIQPQDRYPMLTMNYENIVASCTNSGITCGMKKGSTYDAAMFVSPLDADCEGQFIFYRNGRIDGVTEKAQRTIEVLNLNDYSLVDARAAMIAASTDAALHVGSDSEDYIKENYIDEKDGKLPAFVDMMNYFYSNQYFSEDALLASLK